MTGGPPESPNSPLGPLRNPQASPSPSPRSRLVSPSAPSSGADWLRVWTGGRCGQCEAGEGEGASRVRRERGGGPRERFGHARRSLAAPEAPRATLESQLGSLEGFAGVGALRDAQGVLGVTGVVLRVSEKLFGIPRERFGVEGGWSGSGRRRRDFPVQESRGGPHVVWESLGVVKVAESWHPFERDPQSPHGPPQISPRNSKPSQIPTGLSQLPFYT